MTTNSNKEVRRCDNCKFAMDDHDVDDYGELRVTGIVCNHPVDGIFSNIKADSYCGAWTPIKEKTKEQQLLELINEEQFIRIPSAWLRFIVQHPDGDHFLFVSKLGNMATAVKIENKNSYDFKYVSYSDYSSIHDIIGEQFECDCVYRIKCDEIMKYDLNN